MSATNPTDLLLVSRGGSSYSVQIQDMSTIQDTDLLLINRSGTSYKIEAQDLLGGTAPLIESTSLAIDDPTGPRFTGEDFTLSSTLSQDGQPVSTKKIDAYVRGTLEVSYETDSIDSVTTTASSQTITNPTSASSNGNSNAAATDGNGNWFFIYQDGLYLASATGFVPTYGSPLAVNPTSGAWNVNYHYGIGASKAGTWILTGSKSGGSQPTFILRSTNSGTTWVDATPSSFTSNKNLKWLSHDNAGNWMGLVGSSSPEITTSSDDGVTWSSFQSVSISGGQSIGGLVNYGGSWVFPVEGSGGNYGGYYRSTDFGATWSFSSFPSNAYSGWSCGIQVSDTGTMMTGFSSSNKIIRSTDNGASWTAIAAAGVFGGAVAYGGGTRWIKFTSNSLAESFDDGLTWQTGTASADFTPYLPPILAQAKGVISCPGAGYYTPGSYSDNLYSNLIPNSVELGLSGDEGLVEIEVGMAANNGSTATGTVSSIDTIAPSITLSGTSGTWSTGETVITDPVVKDEAILYLVFNSSGSVTDLSNTPQDPYYSTVDSPVDFTFTFPATFPTGAAPDTELPAGTTLHATVTAFNAAGVSGGAAQVTP